MEAGHLPGAYLAPRTDRLREEVEAPWLADVVRALLPVAGGRVLDLGCGAGLGPLIADANLALYTGLDFRSPGFDIPGDHVLHDLRDGLGPVGSDPYDVYVAGFGLASHLDPTQLPRLLAEIAAHARPGAVVAIEALGVNSLEWPRLWGSRPGPERTLPYALDHDVEVHPWSPVELAGLLADAGIQTLDVRDRSLQSGPALDQSRYWPGLPALRAAMVDLLEGGDVAPALTAALPPLPAGTTAATHQGLAARRHALVAAHAGTPAELAAAIWALERGSSGGFGHGLLAVGRVS